MQRPITTSLAFIDLSVDKKPAVGEDMVTELETYPDLFPNPPQKAPDLGTLNSELTDAVAKARSGDKIAVAELVKVEKRWDIGFRSEAKYVGSVANGDEVIIRKGGCVPTKDQTNPAQVPGSCKNIELFPGPGHGTATIGCDADTSVKAYLYIARTKGATVRQDGNMVVIEAGGETVYVMVDTHRKTIFHKLLSEIKLWVSMLGFNSAGCGPLSDEQTVVPQ